MEDLDALLRSIYPDINGFAVDQIAAKEDAAIIPLGAGNVLVVSLDLMTPVVSDPAHFGKIAAANALSDLYAKGVTPEWALNIAGFPAGLSAALTRQVMKGALDMLRSEGVALVGGHTLASEEIVFGFCCFGRARASEVIRNGGAHAGDDLVLTKPLGTGVVTQGMVELGLENPCPGLFDSAVEVMLQSNAAACAVMREIGVSAATDVSGFGLIGHLSEMLFASGVSAEIWTEEVPVLAGVENYMDHGYPFCTIQRNLTQFGKQVAPSDELTKRVRLLFDSQTSGGLLIAVPHSKTASILSRLQASGLCSATHIGRVLNGGPSSPPIRIERRRAG